MMVVMVVMLMTAVTMWMRRIKNGNGDDDGNHGDGGDKDDFEGCCRLVIMTNAMGIDNDEHTPNADLSSC